MDRIIAHRIWAATLLLAAALTIYAATLPAQPAPQCEQLGRGGVSAVVVCPPGLGKQDWQRAGITACNAPGPCHAWIWDDPVMAPKAPITRANPMTGPQFDSAVALWVGYTQTLFVCGSAFC